MSQENVQLIRRAFDAFSRGDTEGVLAVCAEDIVITQAPEVPLGAPQQSGHAGVLEAFALWPEQWDDFRINLERVVTDPGDHVVVTARHSGRGKQSGVEVEANFTYVFGILDGKVTEWRIYVTDGDALASLAEGG
jgi:ketosteroid isomerase-like protein